MEVDGRNSMNGLYKCDWYTDEARIVFHTSHSMRPDDDSVRAFNALKSTEIWMVNLDKIICKVTTIYVAIATFEIIPKLVTFLIA